MEKELAKFEEGPKVKIHIDSLTNQKKYQLLDKSRFVLCETERMSQVD